MNRPRVLVVSVLCCALGLPTAAQQTQKPESRPAAPLRWGNIETRAELSLAAVFVDLDGSRDKFLSDRYLRSGFNVGGALFEFRPAEGTASFFHFARLSATGLGDSSPYQRADFRIGKRKLYDLNAGYRKYGYFFGVPGFALGFHSENSVGRAANLGLELFPDRKVSFRLDYRRDQLYGTAFSSQDLILDAFPIAYPRRRSSDEFAFGTTLKLRPVSLTLEQSFLRFRDDPQVFVAGAGLSGFRGNLLESGQRDTPTRILTPVSRAVVRYQPGSRFDMVGRYAYSNGDVKLTRFDNFLNRTGSVSLPVRLIISSSGISDKPTHTADITETVELTGRLTAHHHFRYDTYTLSGILDTFGVLRFLNQSGEVRADMPFTERGGTITDYLLARNEITLEYAVAPSVSLLGNYRYSDRHVAFGDRFAQPRPLVTITHSGGAGLAWIPNPKARLHAEFEKGVSSRAFSRNEPLSFLRSKLRGQYRPSPRLTVSANLVFADNRNDTPGVNYDLDDRQVSAQLAYLPAARVLLTGGYNFYRVRTTTDLVFFTLAQLARGQSLYQSDIHLAHVQAQLPVGPRLDLRLGYELVKDSGSSFPLRLHTPRAGLSLLVGKGVRLEADWVHYSYDERAAAFQKYRANVLAAGLGFTF